MTIMSKQASREDEVWDAMNCIHRIASEENMRDIPAHLRAMARDMQRDFERQQAREEVNNVMSKQFGITWDDVERVLADSDYSATYKHIRPRR